MTTKESSSPPRVLQVALSMNPGGTERLVLDLATRLHAEIPMRVCCLDEAGAWASDLERHGITVEALGRQPGFRPGLGRRIARAAKQHRASVIHAHHFSPFVYSAIARWFSPRLRLVFTEHGRVSDAPPSPKRRLANRLVFGRMASHVFAVSEDLRRHIVQEGFSADQVDVIYNGIDVGSRPEPSERDAVRRELGIGPEVGLVGTIARLDPVKDLGTLLQALALVAQSRPVSAVIVGDGAERSRLETMAADLGLTRQVRFLGQRNDARRWLAGCDLFVNSSISEGVSLTILEAMAAAIPVIATAVGGTPEVVTPECGQLVTARDPKALAAAINAMAADASKRRTLGAAARSRVVEHFTLDRMIRQYRNVYMGVG